MQRELLAVNGREFSGKLCAAPFLELHADRPVFLGHECLNLLLAVAYKLDRHRLHAAGGKPLLDLAPEERAELVADDAVEHAARLLRVHAVEVDRVRILDRCLNGGLRDLVEDDAAILVRVDAQNVREMPSDRLAFAVRIACQIDLGGALRILLQRLDEIALAADIDVLRRKVVLNVDAELALRKIAQMPHGRPHHVFLAKILLDRLRLRRRLDNDQGLRSFLLRCSLFRRGLLRNGLLRNSLLRR